MPYQNQYASKTAHSDVIQNPEVREFLNKCKPIREPSESTDQEFALYFQEPPDYLNDSTVKHVLCSDGSFYSSIIDNRLPSIQVCYLKFGTILIEMNDFNGLEDDKTRLVDPFRVAALQRERETLTVVLPLSNFKFQEDDTVKTTFRKQMDQFLWSESTRFPPYGPDKSLMATLIELAQLRPDRDAPPGTIKIHKCPNQDCKTENIYLDPEEPKHHCPRCNTELYLSDCLRLWEEVSDYHANQESASRFMSYVEHLLPIHYIRYLVEEAPAQLSQLSILVDGPLAVFGNAAWLHQSIMRFLHQTQERMRAKNLPIPVVIGLQKSGYVVEYMQLLSRCVKPNRLFSIVDEFRYNYLGVERSRNGFGSETYYGHDFAFKTPSNKIFIFSLPYPFASKSATNDFSTIKANIQLYEELPRAMNLITQVETDLYRDALVPIALAHRYTAISLRPGGRVLDIMGREARNTQ